MAWLTENWVWVLFGVAFIAMHLFGHGGHGGHGNQNGDGKLDGDSRSAEPQKASDEPATGPAAGASNGRETHRH